MSVSIKGTGIFWSIGGVTFTAGIVTGTNGGFFQSVDYSRTGEKTEVKDDGGTIKAVAFHGKKKVLRATIVPNGTTLANAAASAEAHIPTVGTTITVAESVSAGSITMEASYNLTSVSQKRVVDNVVTVDVEMEGSDEGVNITTDVS